VTNPRYRILVMLIVTLAPALNACGLAGPPPVEYVLGPTPAATAATSPITDRPVIELAMVRIPDYLDSTELLVRDGNQLIASKSGRWGERLSVGVTRALAAFLAARLPNIVVTTTPPLKPSARQLLVDVSAFEARSDHQVVLVARWTMADGSGHKALRSTQAVVVEPVNSVADTDVVTGMSQALDDLAGQIAAATSTGR
jgi:uncharacterized lipoprotein YmbA